MEVSLISHTLHMQTMAGQLVQVRAGCQTTPDQTWCDNQCLDAIPAAQMRVVGDEACAPELRPVALEGIAGKHSRSVSGWIKQQVVKLACSFTIQVRPGMKSLQ
jgi:hypothetical protein